MDSNINNEIRMCLIATYSNNLRFRWTDSDIWVLIVNYMICIAYQILR